MTEHQAMPFYYRRFPMQSSARIASIGRYLKRLGPVCILRGPDRWERPTARPWLTADRNPVPTATQRRGVLQGHVKSGKVDSDRQTITTPVACFERTPPPRPIIAKSSA